jgi:hypothetical protein
MFLGVLGYGFDLVKTVTVQTEVQQKGTKGGITGVMWLCNPA